MHISRGVHTLPSFIMKHITKLGIAFISTVSVLAPAASLADTGSTTAAVPALSAGIVAPTIGGTDGVAGKKFTIQYSNSVGSSDSFSVGAATNVGASVSASSTPDYDVTSTAKFGISGSTVEQVIGTKNTVEAPITTYGIEEKSESLSTKQVESDFKKTADNGGGYYWHNRRNKKKTFITDSEYEEKKTAYKMELKEDITKTLTSASAQTGTISGSFAKSFSDSGSSNDVTVDGIGTSATISTASALPSSFDSSIAKGTTDSGATVTSTGAGTASGSASGSVGTTATANANSSQFVSSFAQAY